jgi:hypothetical protein
MRVVLDGTPLTDHASTAAATFAEALGAGATAAQAGGRIIIEVKADGQPVPPEHLSDPASVTATYAELVLRSADPRALVRESLSDASDALGQLAPLHAAVADALATGDTRRAMDQLREVLSTWQAVQDLLEHARALLSLDLTHIRVPDRPDLTFDAKAAQFVATSRTIRDAVQSQDWSALSDAVAYDLDAAAGDWAALIRALAKDVDSRR